DPYYNAVGHDFFRTLGIPIVAGRAFDERDTGEPAVAIVNRRFATLYGLGDNPVGKRMALGSGGPLDIEIVGLAADSAYSSVPDGVLPLLWFPRAQMGGGQGSMVFYVRTAPGAETGVLARIPSVVAALDPDLPVEDLRGFPEQIALGLTVQRFVGAVATGFAVLATLLAALGLYGVLSYSLVQRTRELGLRLALGAGPRRLATMLLRQVGVMALVGAALGLFAAAALGSAAQALLFGLDGHDPGVYALALLVLLGVAFAAALLPARRAAR